MRNLRYNISESFNIFRWVLMIIVVSFVAVVNVYKYIDLSDSVALTFSSLETTYLILNDSFSIVYIFLPLYLFAICGIMLDDNFGALEVIKCGSRGKWLLNKALTLLLYTILFFIGLFILNFLISNRVFPYSDKWSTDFVKFQVSTGQNVENFVSTPLITISSSLLSLFFIYLFAGNISMLISLKTQKEALALAISLVIGIFINLLLYYVIAAQKNIEKLSFVNALLAAGILIIYAICYLIAAKKDFNMEKRN